MLTAPFKCMDDGQPSNMETRIPAVKLTCIISFASCCAFLSLSLKSGALRSNFVVYASSSKPAFTPKSFSFAAN